MKLVVALVLSLVPSAAFGQQYYWGRPTNFYHYQSRVIPAYNLADDYRNYYQGYIDAAWYMQQRAVSPTMPYFRSPAAFELYDLYELSDCYAEPAGPSDIVNPFVENNPYANRKPVR